MIEELEAPPRPNTVRGGRWSFRVGFNARGDKDAGHWTNHGKTLWRTATFDTATGRPISRFKRRRLERDPEYVARFNAAQKATLKARRQKQEAAGVARESKKRLKDAAEGN